jgi:hypothetical protein
MAEWWISKLGIGLAGVFVLALGLAKKAKECYYIYISVLFDTG